MTQDNVKGTYCIKIVRAVDQLLVNRYNCDTKQSLIALKVDRHRNWNRSLTVILLCISYWNKRFSETCVLNRFFITLSTLLVFRCIPPSELPQQNGYWSLSTTGITNAPEQCGYIFVKSEQLWVLGTFQKGIRISCCWHTFPAGIFETSAGCPSGPSELQRRNECKTVIRLHCVNTEHKKWDQRNVIGTFNAGIHLIFRDRVSFELTGVQICAARQGILHTVIHWDL